jgi:hypothetical protein
VGPAPGTGVTRHAPGATFNFDKIDFVQRHHQEIDFVDAAIVRHELEIGPGAKWLRLGQPLAQVAQGGHFPGKGRFCHGDPVL